MIDLFYKKNYKTNFEFDWANLMKLNLRKSEELNPINGSFDNLNFEEEKNKKNPVDTVQYCSSLPQPKIQNNLISKANQKLKGRLI